MKLLDLKPKWIRIDGEVVGLIFLCPRCTARKGSCIKRHDGSTAPVPTWLTCTFKALGQWDQRELIAQTIEENPQDFIETKTQAHDVVGCKQLAWGRTSKMFETITITPSLDASPAGHWHGHIQNGEIVGGI